MSISYRGGDSEHDEVADVRGAQYNRDVGRDLSCVQQSRPVLPGYALSVHFQNQFGVASQHGSGLYVHLVAIDQAGVPRFPAGSRSGEA